MPEEVKDNQHLTRDVEMGGSSTSQQNDQRAKGQGTTCAPFKKRLAAITGEVAEKLQPAHVREVDERYRGAACGWWGLIVLVFTAVGMMAFVNALQERRHNPVNVARTMEDWKYPNVAICNPLGYDVHAAAWSLSYKGPQAAIKVVAIRPDRPPDSDPTAPLYNDKCLWVRLSVLGKGADPSLILLQDRQAIEASVEASPTRVPGFQIIPSMAESSADFAKLPRGRDGMPAPIAWSGLGSTTIQQHYVTWSLTRSTKRHYNGLFKSREITTATFDGVVSSQGSGGFQKGGPNGWDMATSGFAESGDRSRWLWTGTENVTGLVAIKAWTPANPDQYNVMVVSFLTSPWVTDYVEGDPFSLVDTIGTIGGWWAHALLLFTLLFIDANLPVERKLNPSVTKAWRKAYAYFSTPSPNDSFSHRLKTRVSLPPPPVDDNAPPPERVEDKVERLEAEIESLRQQLKNKQP